MARQLQPKIKLMRKIGQDLGLKSNSVKVAKRIAILPGFHGRKGRRKVSDYGNQLHEKQKVKIMYGVLEKQFRQYFAWATKNPKATGTALLTLLERRLDNTIYRLGLAPTRASARQLISHGNVQVNNKRLSIPSYLVEIGDTVNLSNKATKIPYISEMIKQKNVGIPSWLERKGAIAKVTRLPERDDIHEDIKEQLIVEHYSR
jgi:small subunit ribosomal protein S4